MPDHNVPLIATLSIAFLLALGLGMLAARLRLPALVGYLLAGVIIGPFTPGYVADSNLASELAEIGVILLMFGVGLHFSLGDLLSVRRIAVPGAVLQITVATLLGGLVAWAWDWDLAGALVFGITLSTASTVVLLRALEVRGSLASMNGRIAVGWLIVEDLAMVLVLVLLPPLAGVFGKAPVGNESLALTLLITFLKVAAFVTLMLVVGRKVFPKLLWAVAQTGSRELFTLCVIAAAMGIAFFAAQLFGVSFALGAFFAGMVMRESEFSHRAASESLPLQEAFAVLFFVSVGMLFDPTILIEHPWQVLAVVAIIIFGKSFAAAALVLAMRYPLNTALIISASLAQIGEFSFILATLGVSLGLMPKDGQSLIVAASLISIALNPLVFLAIEPAQRWILARSAFARRLDQRSDPYAELPMSTERKFLEGQAVLVGYGRVGRRIARDMDAANIPYVVAEQNRELVEDLRKAGKAAVSGDAATDPAVLIQAHIAHAAMLISATPDAAQVRKMVETAHALNPDIEIILRTHDDDEASLLRADNIGTVFHGEEELAKSMGRHVCERFAGSGRTAGN